MEKGHYGKYTGNARHSNHHMVNSWEEEDVKRGKKEMEEGHKGHAEALFDDAHGSYNWDGHNSTGAEHAPSRKSRSERLRKRAMNRSERRGAEWGDYDYEDPRVQKMLEKANELEARTGEGRKAMHKLTKKIEKMPDGPVWGEMMQGKAQAAGQQASKRQLAGGSFAEEAPESGIYSKAAGQLAPLAPAKGGDSDQTSLHELLHKGLSGKGEQAQEASQHEAQEDSPLNNSCNCQ